MEFYADSSSILIALFEVLFIVFCFVNRFYADHSLSKQIFFFKDVENSHFDINRKCNQVKNLIKLLDPLSEKKIISLKIDNNKSQLPKNNDDKNDIDLNDLEDEINIYNRNKKLTSKESLSKIDETFKSNDARNFLNKKMKNNRLSRKIIISGDENNNGKNKNLNFIHRSRRNLLNLYKVQPNKIPTINFQASNKNELEKMGIIKFNYNIFEIFWSYLGKCCMSNNLKIKSNLTQKSNNILNDKLDISLYIKNTILIDILNQALINDNMKSMTKFISRPIISLNKSCERDLSQFYKNYDLTDFDNLYEEISNMSKKSRFAQAEQKIISSVYNELKEMV